MLILLENETAHVVFRPASKMTEQRPFPLRLSCRTHMLSLPLSHLCRVELETPHTAADQKASVHRPNFHLFLGFFSVFINVRGIESITFGDEQRPSDFMLYLGW